MGDYVPADGLGAEWAGYQFKISGGNDKQGFPMMQGVLKSDRVRLLLKGGSKCYRQRPSGERKKKSVRGCIVASDISILNLVVANKGEGEIEGLTDQPIPRRLGPKRARKAAKLSQRDKVRAEAAEYKRVYDQRRQEAAAKRRSEISKRRSSRRSSRKAE